MNGNTLVAYYLNEQEEYKSQGILGEPKPSIEPQELFEILADSVNCP